MLNQYWGIIRLITLVFIKEFNNKINNREPSKNSTDVKKIKIIRNSIAHLTFEITEKGYIFGSSQGTEEMRVSLVCRRRLSRLYGDRV